MSNIYNFVLNINFGDWLLIAVAVSLLIIFIVFSFGYKRGINIQSHKFQIITIVSVVLPLIVIPFWFTDIEWADKLLVTVLAIVVGVLNYVSIDYFRKKILDKRLINK